MTTPRLTRGTRRAVGAGIVALATLPVYRLLASPETGLAGAATVRAADVAYAFAWTGTLVIVLVSVLSARLLPEPAIERALTSVRKLLERATPAAFAVFTGVLAFGLSAAFAWFALDGRPAHIDAISQLLHARFLAEGRIAGPTDDMAFWHIQNSVATARGWVSQYPPGHAMLLALGLLLGAPWLVGPVAVAATAYFTTRVAERTVEDLPLARAGAILVACSPFLVCLGGSFMNHASAAAFLSAGVWWSMRAVDDRRWSWLAGMALGCAFTIRPLVALTGGAIALVVWLASTPNAGAILQRTARAGAGALPFAGLLAAYNTWFFGSPFRFGYDVALGPSTGLGFGPDPWGNLYGPVQAIGYTASDLLGLGTALLETPLSVVLAAGLLLLLAGRLTRGQRILAAWALLPVVANMLYWHHGQYMGPRMVYEASPAWLLLAVAAVGRAWTALADVRIVPVSLSPRTALVGGIAAALALGAWAAPRRASGYATPSGSVAALAAPDVGPALVFVHDAWTARIAMQLAAHGMRLDSVETALRQNPTCDVQTLVDSEYRRDLAGAAEARASLDFEPRATGLPRTVAISTGNQIRIGGEPPTEACIRQAGADRNGILDIAPLLWQGDLPGGAVNGARFVRDLGPERNAALIARTAGRTPYLLYTPRDGADPVLAPYAAAESVLWTPAVTGASIEDGL